MIVIERWIMGKAKANIKKMQAFREKSLEDASKSKLGILAQILVYLGGLGFLAYFLIDVLSSHDVIKVADEWKGIINSVGTLGMFFVLIGGLMLIIAMIKAKQSMADAKLDKKLFATTPGRVIKFTAPIGLIGMDASLTIDLLAECGAISGDVWGEISIAFAALSLLFVAVAASVYLTAVYFIEGKKK